MEILKLIGIGALVALIIRPFYEFHYNRFIISQELKKLQVVLSDIPYVLDVDSQQIFRIANAHKDDIALERLDELVLPREVWQKLQELDIPLSRYTDYVNEITFFRVEVFKKTIEKQEADFVKYLPKVDYRKFVHISIMVNELVENIAKTRVKELLPENKMKYLKDFNHTLQFATNFGRMELHPYFLNRWDLTASESGEGIFPIFTDNADYESRRKRLSQLNIS